MPKWSDFIRDLGTSGPPTLQGIYALGFALRSEIPALFAKYVRVDASQTFTSPEKQQGRTNLGLGNVDDTSDANKPVSTATLNALNLKAPLASPALTGNPTAPTQTVGDSSTKLATTAFVAASLPPALAAAASKTTPVDADTLPLTDSAASNALKKLTWGNLKSGVIAAIGPFIAAATAKAVPVAADNLLIADSAASNVNKKVSFSALFNWILGQVVGTVSQSGGVPTGAIIEKGSNANGDYTRWADGTQICWRSGLTLTVVTPGTWVNTGALNFAAAFVAAPMVSASLGSPVSNAATSVAANATATTYTAFLNCGLTASNQQVSVMAVGRWF